MHWVSAPHSLPSEVRLYDRLFADERPTEETAFNPNSLEVLTGSRVEPGMKGVNPGDRFQFERLGYFCVDPDSKPGALVFNRTVTLRDTWAKIEKGASTTHRRVSDERIEQIAREVLLDFGLTHPVFAARELPFTPEHAKGQKVVRIQFSDGYEDIEVILGPGYNEKSIRKEIVKVISLR